MLAELDRYDTATRSRRLRRAMLTNRGPEAPAPGCTLLQIDVDELTRGALRASGTTIDASGARWYLAGREVDREAFLVAARGA